MNLIRRSERKVTLTRREEDFTSDYVVSLSCFVIIDLAKGELLRSFFGNHHISINDLIRF